MKYEDDMTASANIDFEETKVGLATFLTVQILNIPNLAKKDNGKELSYSRFISYLCRRSGNTIN